MRKNGVLLLVILLCVAFLVSCGKKKNDSPEQKGELVRYEAGEMISQPCLFGKRIVEQMTNGQENIDHF